MTVVDANKARYIPRPIVMNGSFVNAASVRYGVYDTITDQWLRASFPQEYLAQEKANELNRLKSPH